MTEPTNSAPTSVRASLQPTVPMSPLMRPVAAMAGAILGGAWAAFPVVGMNGVDLFDRSARAYPTVTPKHILTGQIYGEGYFVEGPRTPGLTKTLAWGVAGAGLVALGVATALGGPLVAALAAAVGTHTPIALVAAGFGAGICARAALNVLFTPFLAATYGSLRGALLMARGSAAPLTD